MTFGLAGFSTFWPEAVLNLDPVLCLELECFGLGVPSRAGPGESQGTQDEKIWTLFLSLDCKRAHHRPSPSAF
jgi:hypothetical protein